MQISTDYVYGGQRQREPLTEAVTPAPLNVYGASKLGGEYAVRALCPRHYVIRSCGLYGVAGVTSRNGNFVQTMLRLARAGRAISVVNDQHCTPTATADLAQAVRHLLAAQAPFGLYHVTNAGQTTWYEFAQRIFALAGLSPELAPISTADVRGAGAATAVLGAVFGAVRAGDGMRFAALGRGAGALSPGDGGGGLTAAVGRRDRTCACAYWGSCDTLLVHCFPFYSHCHVMNLLCDAIHSFCTYP